jgi:hypothetical protein
MLDQVDHHFPQVQLSFFSFVFLDKPVPLAQIFTMERLLATWQLPSYHWDESPFQNQSGPNHVH